MYRMQQEIKTGRELFVRHCTGCHAMDAKGLGPSRAFYTSKPRNLVEGNFKFRSTPLGTLPTREDLLRTLTKGIPPSSMPPFNFLPSSQREAIVSYIQSLRPDWNKLQGEQVFIPSVPAKLRKKDTFLASAYNGQKTFQELCVLCHGLEGKGDGPGSQGLFDSDNQPIVPANLNARYLKSGRGARDIFRTITTGLDGTPMPSFGEALNEDKRWELVAFVLYLRGKEAGVYPQDLKLGTGK
jgi:cytochrome c oxidase cbb3-type subunit 2